VFGVRSGLLGTELVLRFGFKVKSGIGSGDGDFSGAGGESVPHLDIPGVAGRAAGTIDDVVAT